MLRIRFELHEWYNDLVLTRGENAPNVAAQRAFAFLLIESRWYEDKLAAILFMQEVLLAHHKLGVHDLPAFARVFNAGHVAVYKVADHFAEKVLAHVTARAEPQAPALEALLSWTHAPDLWQARAALAALVHFVDDPSLRPRLFPAISAVLARPEDEAKSIAGAALRTLSRSDPDAVIRFLSDSATLAATSVVALQKATQSLPPATAAQFKELRRDAVARRRSRH